ncbi:MAG: CoA pyrophosphatase [Pseudomonadales bacterium]
MSHLSIQHIRSRVAAHQPERFPVNQETRQAAVAVVLHATDKGPEILFIKRARHDADPWSGHMAFPGGHRDPVDTSLKAAAVRETLEEIGLDLDAATFLGPLSQQHAMPRGQTTDMLVAPFVFEIDELPVFSPNHEVDEIVWGPLDHMRDRSLCDTETRRVGSSSTVFNGYRLAGGHFVWGLTYRALQTFFKVLDPSYVAPDD